MNEDLIKLMGIVQETIGFHHKSISNLIAVNKILLARIEFLESELKKNRDPEKSFDNSTGSR